MMSTRPTRAAIYCRISEDREGREVGVQAQEADCRRLAEHLGWQLHPTRPVYNDNDRGASTLSKKRRPEYEALLDAVRAGDVDAVLYYSNSRLTRRPMEYATIEELVRDTGVRLASVTGGLVDLTTADGRMIGGILARVDQAEAERIGERVARRWQTRRESGQPHSTGLRPFGFEPDGITPHASEADAIRGAARLILSGGSLGDVVDAWTNGRPADDKAPAIGKVRPVTGGRWSRTTVRRALTRPRVAGQIEHRGKVVGTMQGEPILPVSEWIDVRAKISDRSGLVRARFRGREHLLSGFVYCGVCGRRMKVSARRDENGEVRADSFVSCIKDNGGCGHVKRNLLLVESFVLGAVEARLAAVPDLDTGDDDTGDVARLEAERDRLAAEMEALQNLYLTDATFIAADYVPMIGKLRSRADEVDDLLADAQAPGPDLPGDPLEVWTTGTLADRREVLEAVVERITLDPIGKVGPVRARAMVPETTHIDWR